MKKLLSLSLAALLGLGSFASLGAQTFDSYEDTIESMAATLSPSLPSVASLGGTWSDAYIGSIIGVPPHFGVGASVGAVLMPSEAFTTVLSTFGESLPTELAAFADLGVPFPSVVLEGRVGGLILPFDVGLKVGTIPGDVDTADFAVNYLAVGGDVRYALLKENILLPAISLGVGVNYLKGGLGYTFNNITLNDVGGPGVNVTVNDPTINFGWEATVFDAKLQVSKNLLILTPYVGLGASLGNTTVSGGFNGNLGISGGGTVEQLESATGQDFSSNGFTVSKVTEGVMSYRIYGGASLNILLLKVDVQAIYNFGDPKTPETGALGANVGVRFQL